MKFLLDTHILLWWLMNDQHLPKLARMQIENEENEIYYSIVSLFEMQIKQLSRPGSIQLPVDMVVKYCDEFGFQEIAMRERHILRLPYLRRAADAPPHKDPFDKILLCQAIVEGARFMTHDSQFPYYEEPCVYFV